MKLQSLLLLAPLLLAGCALTATAPPTPTTEPGTAITGTVHGGQQAVVGAHVYLMAANTTGYGGAGLAASTSNASISLLTSATGHSDAIGYYVPTASDGSFTITGDYTCTSGQQVYLYALGGWPISGVAHLRDGSIVAKVGGARGRPTNSNPPTTPFLSTAPPTSPQKRPKTRVSSPQSTPKSPKPA